MSDFKIKFQGDIEELKSVMSGAGIEGNWREMPDVQSTQWRFTTADGNLNWWPSKGTMFFNGKGAEILELMTIKALDENLKPKYEAIREQNGDVAYYKVGRGLSDLM